MGQCRREYRTTYIVISDTWKEGNKRTVKILGKSFLIDPLTLSDRKFTHLDPGHNLCKPMARMCCLSPCRWVEGAPALSPPFLQRPGSHVFWKSHRKKDKLKKICSSALLPCTLQLCFLPWQPSLIKEQISLARRISTFQVPEGNPRHEGSQ